MATPGETRIRILEAALACVERWGLTKTSLEDVATEAGISRATLYRYFPGGRDEVITETVRWEVERFLNRMVAAVAAEPGLEQKLARALVVGHQAIDEHKLLQRTLSNERAALLSELAGTEPVMRDTLRAYLVDELHLARTRPGIDLDEAADYLARLYLTYLGSQGRWDLTDEREARRLVRSQFLAGIVVPPAPAPADAGERLSSPSDQPSDHPPSPTRLP